MGEAWGRRENLPVEVSQFRDTPTYSTSRKNIKEQEGGENSEGENYPNELLRDLRMRKWSGQEGYELALYRKWKNNA